MTRTDDGTNLVRLYLEQIAQEPVLAKEDEQALARDIEAGAAAARELADGPTGMPLARRATLEETVAAGEHARDRFVRANLRLVVSVARHGRAPTCRCWT